MSPRRASRIYRANESGAPDYPLFLGIDIGTTNCRALLCDVEGNEVSQSSLGVPLISRSPLEAEQDPSDWWQSVVAAVRSCIRRAGVDPSLVAGLSVDSHLEAWVCVDQSGQATTNGLLWLDRRTAALVDEVKSRLDENFVISETGVPINYVNPALKVLWLKANRSEAYCSAKYILSPKDFINLKLTGEVATDATMASKSMLAKVTKSEWSTQICRTLDIDLSLLPPIRWASERLGPLRAEPAEEMGLRPGIPVAVGGGDDYCQALSCGAMLPGDLSIGTGTGSAWKAVVDSVMLDFSGAVECHRYFLPTLWVLWTGINSTGYSIQWFFDNLSFAGTTSWEKMNELASRIDVGCDGLYFYPHFWGARIPRLNPAAKGVFWGLGPRHSLPHLYRAMLEGVAFHYVAAFETLARVGGPPNRVTMVGGEVQNDFWNQMKADALGMPISVPKNRVGSAFGSALLAAVAGGAYGSLEEATRVAVRWERTFEPVPELTDRYRAVARVYHEVYRKIEPAFSIGSDLTAC